MADLSVRDIRAWTRLACAAADAAREHIEDGRIFHDPECSDDYHDYDLALGLLKALHYADCRLPDLDIQGELFDAIQFYAEEEGWTTVPVMNSGMDQLDEVALAHAGKIAVHIDDRILGEAMWAAARGEMKPTWPTRK